MTKNHFYLLQPVYNRNEIFSCVRPQIKVNRRGKCYTPMHMRYHLISFVEENYDLMSSILKGPLEVRGMNLDVYLRKMRICDTCGYEITLLILTHMYKVPILVIRSDMLWLSSNVTAVDCPIVLVQKSSGEFLGTKTKCPVFVGDLPKIKFPRKPRAKKTTVLKHSTPVRNTDVTPTEFGQEILSPIVEKSSKEGDEENETCTEDDSDTKKVREDVRNFETANLSTTVDGGTTFDGGTTVDGSTTEHNVMESSIISDDRMVADSELGEGTKSAIEDGGGGTGVGSINAANNGGKHNGEEPVKSSLDDSSTLTAVEVDGSVNAAPGTGGVVEKLEGTVDSVRNVSSTESSVHVVGTVDSVHGDGDGVAAANRTDISDGKSESTGSRVHDVGTVDSVHGDGDGIAAANRTENSDGKSESKGVTMGSDEGLLSSILCTMPSTHSNLQTTNDEDQSENTADVAKRLTTANGNNEDNKGTMTPSETVQVKTVNK